MDIFSLFITVFLDIATGVSSVASDGSDSRHVLKGQLEYGNPSYDEFFVRDVAPKTRVSNFTFNCEPSYSAVTPTSVHKLRPSDIKVVAGLGDSVTTGNGVNARNLLEVFESNRGEAWSMGGKGSLDEHIVTLPNILRKFNPGLKGYSVGKGSEGGTEAWLNVAVIGDKSEDLTNQMRMLIEKMRHDARIDVQNDWKLVTILTGGNEMCSYCEDRERFAPEKFKADFQSALDLLKAEIPRVFVNLVAMMDITVLPLVLPGWYCSRMQWKLCYCAKNETARPELKEVKMAYYQGLQELATSGRYDAEDFTVVVQPHMVNMEYPKDTESGKWDPSFISHDCFHPNEKAHFGFAYTLWNTMLTPVPEKPLAYPVQDEIDNPVFKCPTESQPYIFTNKNSKQDRLRIKVWYK